MRTRIVIFVAAGLCTTVLSCKRKAASRTKSNSVNDQCMASIPNEMQIRLQEAVANQLKMVFAGQQAATSVKQVIEQTADGLAENDSNKKASLELLAGEFARGQITEKIMPDLIESALSNSQISANTAGFVASLGLPTDSGTGGPMDPIRFLTPQIEVVGHYSRCLIQAGARFEQRKWILEGADISKEQLPENACLRTALAYFFGPKIVSEEALQNAESIIIGSDVIRVKKGFKVVSKTTWEKNIKETLDRWNREFANYLAASNNGATYTEMIKAGGGWWNYGDNVSTSSISKEGSYNTMLGLRDSLRSQGAGPKLLIEINNAMQAAVKFDDENIRRGIQTLIRAQWAAVAALATPLVIAAAPFVAGSLFSAQAAVFASASMAALPLSFTFGLSAVEAAVVTYRHGGSFFCNMADKFATEGASAIQMAPFIAALPLASMGTGSAAAWYYTPAMGTRVYGISQVVTAVGFLAQTGNAARQELVQCKSLLDEVIAIANDASEQSSVDLANAKLTEAINLCARGGIDLAFTAKGTLELLKPRKAGEKDRGCLGLGECGINYATEDKPIAANIVERVLTVFTRGLRTPSKSAGLNALKTRVSSDSISVYGEKFEYRPPGRGPNYEHPKITMTYEQHGSSLLGVKIDIATSDRPIASLIVEDPHAGLALQTAIRKLNEFAGEAKKRGTGFDWANPELTNGVVSNNGSKVTIRKDDTIQVPIVQELLDYAAEKIKNPEGTTWAQGEGGTYYRHWSRKNAPFDAAGFENFITTGSKDANFVPVESGGGARSVAASVNIKELGSATMLTPEYIENNTAKGTCLVGNWGSGEIMGIFRTGYKKFEVTPLESRVVKPNMIEMFIELAQKYDVTFVDARQKTLIAGNPR